MEVTINDELKDFPSTEFQHFATDLKLQPPTYFKTNEVTEIS